MKKVRPFWKLILGAVLGYFGWYLVAPQMGETTLTAAAVIGIAFIVLGVTLLSEVFG